MRVIEHTEIRLFRERAMPLLMERECENCVMLGIIGRLIEGKAATRSGEVVKPLLLTVETDGVVSAAALQTPPHALLFSPLEQVQAGAIADHLRQRNWQGSEFSGIVPSVRWLADAWRRAVGRDYQLHVGMRLFRNSRVIDPPTAPGSLRIATVDDLPLMTEWVDAFGREIHESFTDPARAARLAIEEGRLHFWEVDDEPRSICAWQGPTPNSVRIGLVYTPKQFRGHGYASNAVAELTRRQLLAGRACCTLFTDVRNPTSNSVYQKIGYKPVADFEHVKFI